jgi:hypothetical protein
MYPLTATAPPCQSTHSSIIGPAPELVRDVAKFVGFAQFYSQFIPQFEQHISALRKIMRHEYTESVDPYWTQEVKAEFMDIRSAILANPCLKRYDHRLLLVLWMDFSQDGFGYVALQPGDDADSQLAMKR